MNRIKKRKFKMYSVILGFLIASFLSPATHAAGGRLKKFEPQDSTPNWAVENPKVVLALGFLQQDLVDKYSLLAHEKLEPRLKNINPKIRLEVIRASGNDI